MRATWVLGTALFVIFAVILPAGAVEPVRVGWWSQLRPEPVIPMVAPMVSEGGISVQQGGAGPLAIAAIRYEAVSGGSAFLTLVAQDGAIDARVVLRACPTESEWVAPADPPGAWNDRPDYSEPCADGVVDADGAAVTFEVGSLLDTFGVVDLVVAPGNDAGPFVVAFEPPGPDSLRVSGAQPVREPVRPVPEQTDEWHMAGSATGAPQITSPADVPGWGTATLAVERGTEQPDAVEPPRMTDTSLTDLPVAGPGTSAAQVAGDGHSLTLVAVAVLLTGWWILVALPARRGSKRHPVAASTGPSGEPAPVAGVGRFVRSRSTAPKSLR